MKKITGTEEIMSEILLEEYGEIREDALVVSDIRSMLHHLWQISKKLVLFSSIFTMMFTLLASANAFGDTENVQEPIKVKSVQVSGMFDVHNESLITDTLKRSQSNGITLYVIKLDSNAVAGGNIKKTATALKNANVATAIWVGPASVVYSEELNPLLKVVDFIGAADKNLAKKTGAKIISTSFREFIADLDNKNVARLGKNIVLDTGCSKAEIDTAKEVFPKEAKDILCQDVKLEGDEKFLLNIAPTFEKLSPIANLAHALINPSFTLGLLVLGLCLLAFEFYAASVGVAGIAGILALIMSTYGLGYLPTNWWAIAILVLGIFSMVIDVQAGGIGFYTILGSILTVVGIFFATGRDGAYATAYSANAIILVMALLFMIGAIPSLIRTRFGTPTIGREDFIGDIAIADGDVSSKGSVKLRGASWKARTTQVIAVKDGEKCKVVKISGVVLEVESID